MTLQHHCVQSDTDWVALAQRVEKQFDQDIGYPCAVQFSGCEPPLLASGLYAMAHHIMRHCHYQVAYSIGKDFGLLLPTRITSPHQLANQHAIGIDHDFWCREWVKHHVGDDELPELPPAQEIRVNETYDCVTFLWSERQVSCRVEFVYGEACRIIVNDADSDTGDYVSHFLTGLYNLHLLLQ